MSCVARPYSESVKRAPIHPSTTSERSAHRAIIPKAARYNANTFLRHIIRHLVRHLSRYRVSRLFIFLIFFPRLCTITGKQSASIQEDSLLPVIRFFIFFLCDYLLKFTLSYSSQLLPLCYITDRSFCCIRIRHRILSAILLLQAPIFHLLNGR